VKLLLQRSLRLYLHQLKNDLSSLISKVAHEFLPQLQFLHKKAAVNVIPENADDLARKNTIVP
jgi:hypothetical protein